MWNENNFRAKGGQEQFSAVELRFDFQSLQDKLRAKIISPTEIVKVVYQRIRECNDSNIWTYLESENQALQRAIELEKQPAAVELPLYGLPFSVKDNIDVAGVPTTCGCNDWSYTPAESSPAVDNLIKAGAIFIGKNNLDQFANGLVGIRCPRGACLNAIHPDYVPGGSSSGSAVAVSRGQVSFSLGTDTGGSGRVPAALNNIVGLKPTCGSVSSRGLFYANRSLDCVTVFALMVKDASAAFEVIKGYDAKDPFSRATALESLNPKSGNSFRFAVPEDSSLEFFGDEEARQSFSDAVSRLTGLGGTAVKIPFKSFFEAGRLLFDGPWIVERWLATKSATDTSNPTLTAATRSVLDKAANYSALDVFAGKHQLQALRRQCDDLWQREDFLIVPTTGTALRVSEVEADPVPMNARNGYYTYFANLLDLCGMAVPSGFKSNGMPFGICILGRAFNDRQVAGLAHRYHHASGGNLGATTWLL